jgi:hypothetical protein
MINTTPFRGQATLIHPPSIRIPPTMHQIAALLQCSDGREPQYHAQLVLLAYPLIHREQTHDHVMSLYINNARAQLPFTM